MIACATPPTFAPDGDMIFQPGAYTDHADYAYAGRMEKVPGMEPLKVPGIAPDSSHQMRIPLELLALRAERTSPAPTRGSSRPSRCRQR